MSMGEKVSRREFLERGGRMTPGSTESGRVRLLDGD
jgi:hypothetical protein